MEEDYSLAAMERRSVIANGGKPLTEKQLAEVRQLHDQLVEAQMALDDYRAARETETNQPLSSKAMAALSNEADAARARIKARANARERSEQSNNVFRLVLCGSMPGTDFVDACKALFSYALGTVLGSSIRIEVVHLASASEFLTNPPPFDMSVLVFNPTLCVHAPPQTTEALLDGPALVSHVNRRFGKPLIVVSNEAFYRGGAPFIDAGAIAYFALPFTRQAVTEALRQYFSRSADCKLAVRTMTPERANEIVDSVEFEISAIQMLLPLYRKPGR